MNDKRSTLDLLREELSRWEALLAGLSVAQVTAPQLDEGWSVKDVVAHLHAWQLRSNARLEGALHGREPQYPPWPSEFDPEIEGEPHDLNAWLYAHYRDQPWQTIYGNWNADFRRLLQLADALPEDDLLEAGKYAWLEGYPLLAVLQGTLEHHREHAEYLEPQLAQLRQ